MTDHEKAISAIKEIENAMERWHHARDNDEETLQKINDILVGVGLLEWFNKDKTNKNKLFIKQLNP